jgi:hypothetical protein
MLHEAVVRMRQEGFQNIATDSPLSKTLSSKIKIDHHLAYVLARWPHWDVSGAVVYFFNSTLIQQLIEDGPYGLNHCMLLNNLRNTITHR